MTIVVDASVVAKWILEEPGSDFATAILSAVEHEQLALLAPETLAAEIANLLWKAVWQDRMRAADAEERYAAFTRVCPPLVRDSQLAGAALELAIRYQRSVYDCLYVALAEQAPCQFVTADEKLYNALKDDLPGVKLLREFALERKFDDNVQFK